VSLSNALPDCSANRQPLMHRIWVRLRRAVPLLTTALLLWCTSHVAMAEPYLALQQGYKCVQCHINPTGGGLRNNFGMVFAENVLPMNKLPEGAPVWLGQAVQDIIRVGGDLRTQYFDQQTPHQNSRNGFLFEQFRVYADVTLIPNLLGVYVDEQVAPDGAQNMEAYARIGSQSSWYMKAGQFYLPFGWRLQDQSSLKSIATVISMTTPDRGVEFGMERGDWSAQLDITNGVLNEGKPNGYQVTANVVRTEAIWRIGASGSFTQSSGGDRNQGGLYGGLRTGPVVWLTEVDLVHQDSSIAGIAEQSMIPAFIEADWLIHRGNNLKLTYDYLDPQRNAQGNGQSRWSAVYELTPYPFLQLRTGLRRYSGPSQINSENSSFGFLELHLFL
jgi:hypothetical protein